MSGLAKKTVEDIRMRGYKAASKYDWKGMLDVFDELANLLEETQDQLAHVADDMAKALDEAAIKCEQRADEFQKKEGFRYSEDQTNAESGLRDFAYELETMAAEYRAIAGSGEKP